MSTKVPPDGGWGWIIVLAFSINGLSTIPIIQGFGLIFKDTFPRLGFNAMDATIIINTNLAAGMVLGLVNGPLLRTFGYRRVAIVGSVVYTIGVTLTAFSTNFLLIMFSYGIVSSLAMGTTMSAFSFALNSYFLTKRGRAMSLAQTINGLGPIIMPHFTSFLISVYGFQGTILLFGAISLHSLIGALLLQPIKWHLKEIKNVDVETAEKLQNTNTGEEDCQTENEDNAKNSMMDLNRFQRKRRTTTSSIDIDHDIEVGSIYGFETPLPRQLSETLKTPSWDRNLDKQKTYGYIGASKTSLKYIREYEHPLSYSARSINTIHLGSCMKIFEEEYLHTSKKDNKLGEVNHENKNGKHAVSVTTKVAEAAKNESLSKETEDTEMNLDADSKDRCKQKPIAVRIFERIVDFYDLSLLRDPIYVNLMLGMSIAIFAEINFSLLTPFILADMDFSTNKIATVMSVIAGVDLVFRSLAPFLGDWLRQSARNMYLLSLCLLMISRTTLILVDGYISVIFIATALGAAKGIRSVYMPLVLPSYVPIDRLPYASGLQMLTNGIILITAGPLFGVIRDITGSYKLCIVMMNCVTALAVTMWTMEILILRRVNSRKKQQQPENGSLLQGT